jgi:ribosomal protein S18 acetylase RimI-like enzyme
MTPEWSDWRAKTVIWFHSLYVLEEVRGQGAFSMMYEYLRQMVEVDESLAGLRLYTEVSNTGAQQSYERLGMKRGSFYLYQWMVR